MKSILKKLLLILIAICPTLASANVYTYRIKSFQKTTPSCAVAAQAIGKRFASATGHAVLAAACDHTVAWLQDVVIQYQATSEARLITTLSDFTSSQGTYATAADCEANLSSEKALFEKATGLAAVVAFCFRENSISANAKFPFVARIDGFGTPVKSPFVFSGSILEIPEFSRDVLEQRLALAIRSMPTVENPRLRVDLAGVMPYVVVKYYSTRRRSLTLESTAGFESMDACRSRAGTIDAILSNLGVDKLTSFCAGKRFNSAAHYYAFGLTIGPFTKERIPGTYETRTECEIALSSVIARYSEANGTKVRGFCSYDSPEEGASYAFNIVLLWEQ